MKQFTRTSFVSFQLTKPGFGETRAKIATPFANLGVAALKKLRHAFHELRQAPVLARRIFGFRENRYVANADVPRDGN